MSGLAGTERSPFAATPLVAVSTFAAFWAAGSIIELGAWLERSAVALVAVTAVIMLARLLTRTRLIPSLAGAAATFLVLVPLYARDAGGGVYWLPTPSSVSALFRSFSDGASFADDTIRPLPVDSDFAALLTLAILALFVAVEHLAVSWRAVGAAGLLLLVPWVPAIVLQQNVSGAAIAIALAAWVLALALARTDAVARRRVSWTTSVLGTSAALILALLVVPSAIGGAGWGAFPGRFTPDIFDGRNTQLNLEVDLRDSLTVNSEQPVFAYVTTTGQTDAFRIYSFTNFTGSQWEYTDAPVTTHGATETLLWPLPVDSWSEDDRTGMSVAILSLSASHLPTPVAPRTANVDGPWFYDPGTDQIVGDDTTTHDLRYSLVVDFAFQNSEALQASDAALALGQVEDLNDPAYRAIPEALDEARILALTREVTEGVTSRYDRAIAIQQYLRDPQNFVYDTTATSASGDAVSDFLDSRHGYCIQFATTMVMMLRSIDIPARLSEGFLPGTLENGTYVVRGADAHAWPEVYFPGHGWVRFEPTPEIQTGPPPSWTDPDSELPGQPDTPPGGLPHDQPVAVPETPDTGDAGLPVWVIAAIAFGAVVAGAVAALWWRRGGVTGRGRHALRGPEAAWHRLNRLLGSRGWPASATPREATEHVLREIRIARGGPAGPEADAAARALGAAVSDQRYAPLPREVADAQLSAWVDAVMAEATPVDGSTGRPGRGAARSAPRGGS